MYEISSNYQINFTGLVPQSQYSGKPKLQRWQINQIYKIKQRIKTIDDELFKKEAEISNESSNSNLLQLLNKELIALQNSRNDALADIKLIKTGIPINNWKQYSSENYVRRFLKPVEDSFNNTFGE